MCILIGVNFALECVVCIVLVVDVTCRQVVVLITMCSFVDVLGTGVPRLACLRPAAWLKGGPARPVFTNTNPRPSGGAKPRGADDRKLPQAPPHQAGSRGRGEIKAGVPHEVLMTQAMMIETRRAPACAVSLFPLWCKGSKHIPRH